MAREFAPTNYSSPHGRRRAGTPPAGLSHPGPEQFYFRVGLRDATALVMISPVLRAKLTMSTGAGSVFGSRETGSSGPLGGRSSAFMGGVFLSRIDLLPRLAPALVSLTSSA
jgi:hypothetical protein